ncbi:MAG: hypothetical protein QW331_02570, partial [Candidatus Woesearchaeota archaeon]
EKIKRNKMLKKKVSNNSRNYLTFEKSAFQSPRNSKKNFSGFLRSKKAIEGQIFIYVLSIVVFSLIMLFGYGAIRNLMERGEQAQLIKFKSDLQYELKSISTQYGDVKIFSEKNPFRIPGNYKELCFIDNRHDPDSLPIKAEVCNYLTIQDKEKAKNYAFICDAWKTIFEQRKSNIKVPFQNVFFVPQAPSPIVIEEDIRIDKDNNGVEDNPGLLCITIRQGRADFKVKGGGDHVLISPAPVAR